MKICVLLLLGHKLLVPNEGSSRAVSSLVILRDLQSSEMINSQRLCSLFAFLNGSEKVICGLSKQNGLFEGQVLNPSPWVYR